MRLPFADRAFPAVAAFWISTGADDFRAVMREAARVLAPGGKLLFYGAHPWFNGPCAQVGSDGARTVHPTYRVADWRLQLTSDNTCGAFMITGPLFRRIEPAQLSPRRPVPAGTIRACMRRHPDIGVAEHLQESSQTPMITRWPYPAQDG